MLKRIDDFLDRITMYRIVLFELIGLVGVSIVAAFVHRIPYQPISILFSTLFITAVCLIVNRVCARVFKAPTNVESVYITALILALIIAPPGSPGDGAYFSLSIWASVWAMASKYVFAIRNKHLFNPAAFGIALTALTLNQSANWWVGTPVMFPFVLVGGWLVVRKIRRLDVVLAFLASTSLFIIVIALIRGVADVPFMIKTFTNTPLLFFATVMLTEPLTTPPTRSMRLLYGGLAGLLYTPWIHLGSFYTTPELALLAGNLFSYAVSPKHKLLLTLKRKVPASDNTLDLIFQADRRMKFEPGQYLEWTLAHPKPDSRGNRRFFTIASAPSEQELHIGVKFYSKGSSFKSALSAMHVGDSIVASQLSGDFVLPRRKDVKLAFIAGGIGVTPFRSMIKDLTDRNERRDIVMLYANNTPADVAYSEVFEAARRKLGIRTIYVVADPAYGTIDQNRRKGLIDARMIKEVIPDYLDRHFYLSGPHAMVVAFDTILRQMGVHASKIKKDFFPGFA